MHRIIVELSSSPMNLLIQTRSQLRRERSPGRTSDGRFFCPSANIGPCDAHIDCRAYVHRAPLRTGYVAPVVGARRRCQPPEHARPVPTVAELGAEPPLRRNRVILTVVPNHRTALTYVNRFSGNPVKSIEKRLRTYPAGALILLGQSMWQPVAYSCDNESSMPAESSFSWWVLASRSSTNRRVRCRYHGWRSHFSAPPGTFRRVRKALLPTTSRYVRACDSVRGPA